MTGGPLNGIATSFTYDSGNRLIQAGDTEYAYDADNNRVSATTGEDTTQYVYDEVSDYLSRLLIISGPDGESTYYIYGKGLIGEEDAEGNYSLYHLDMRGSTAAITDINGDVTDTYAYGVYGDLLSHTGSCETPFLYNGRDGVMTDANGLYYLRARYYSPELMRFVNADTVKGNINDSRTLNNYAYANGDPISYVDPFGTCAVVMKQLSDLVHQAMGAACLVPNPLLSAAAGYMDYELYMKEGNYLGAWFAIFGASFSALGFGEQLAGYVSSYIGATGGSVEALILKPDVGRKLEYMFGNASGDIHNIERSMQLEKQLNSIGIYDDAAGRSYMNTEIEKAFYNSMNGIKQSNGRIVIESIVTGPYGVLKMETVWEGNSLVTVYLYGMGK